MKIDIFPHIMPRRYFDRMLQVAPPGMALQKRMPMIWLLDSAGARIQEASGSIFAGSGHLFREEVTMSGVVPLVAAMMGPCAAGPPTFPVSPTSSRWSSGRARWRSPDPT